MWCLQELSEFDLKGRAVKRKETTARTYRKPPAEGLFFSYSMTHKGIQFLSRKKCNVGHTVFGCCSWITGPAERTWASAASRLKVYGAEATQAGM